MKTPPLLEERSHGLEAVSVLAGPILFGALTGFLLGESKGLYLLANLIAIIGAIAAGFEHRAPLEAAYRGLLGGLLFGVSILTVWELSDKAAKANIPSHPILVAVITGIAGALLGALGGALRRRTRRRAAPARAAR